MSHPRAVPSGVTLAGYPKISVPGGGPDLGGARFALAYDAGTRIAEPS